MLTDIQNVIYLKKIIYFLENEVGTIEERINWLRNMVKDIPVSVLASSSVIEKIKIFCSQYNVSTNFIRQELPGKQNKKAKNNESTADKLLQNEFAGLFSELGSKLVDKETYYQTLETMCSVIILENDFKKIPEIEYKLYANLDEPITSKNKHSHSTFSPEEIQSLRKTKALVCFSFFLQGYYLSCAQKIFQFIERDSRVLDNSLWNPKYDLIQAEDLYSMISISTLLTIPLHTVGQFTQLPDVLFYFEVFPSAKDLFYLLKKTRFKSFFSSWTKIFNPICLRNQLVGPKLDEIERALRTKVYIFYLSISTQIQVSYLSNTLGIPYDTVLNDIQELFSQRKINFVLEGDIISYKKRSILNDIASILQSNEIEISKLLEVQNKKNTELKDSIQNSIIENNKTNDISIAYDDEDLSMNLSNSDTFGASEAKNRGNN